MVAAGSRRDAAPPASRPHGYRDDPAVPRFPDDRPLVVFDGVCVLCSGFARLVLRADRRAVFRFASAQSALGQALYRHYGLDPVRFESNLVIADGRLHLKRDAFAAVMRRLPWPWRIGALARCVPRPAADRLYDLVARNRYALLGRRDACLVPTPALRERFLD